MGKSFSAKVIADLLEFFGMYAENNCERLIAGALSKGEKVTPPPRKPKTRYQDTSKGRIFFANEESTSPNTVFYLHGGAYFMDFTKAHWRFMETLVKGADAHLIAPAYRLAPFATYREAFDLIVPLYREYCEAHPDRHIILMGDSAGGGLSLALAQHFKAEGYPPARQTDPAVPVGGWLNGK